MSLISLPEEYKVQLEVFEGPLDLLLYLIKKNEVDIYDIPIALITDQYVEYLNVMRMLDLNVAGEFIVMAATLMLIKSRMLLPPDRRPEMEAEEEDPRWELVRQLVEYRKFKEAATYLKDREIQQENVFALGGVTTELKPEPGLNLQDVGIFDLITAFNAALKRVPVEDLSKLFVASFSVADKMEAVMNVLAAKKSVAFTSLLEHMATRAEIVCTFLAVLELIRLRMALVAQEEHFGEIMIVAAEQ